MDGPAGAAPSRPEVSPPAGDRQRLPGLGRTQPFSRQLTETPRTSKASVPFCLMTVSVFFPC